MSLPGQAEAERVMAERSTPRIEDVDRARAGMLELLHRGEAVSTEELCSVLSQHLPPLTREKVKADSVAEIADRLHPDLLTFQHARTNWATAEALGGLIAQGIVVLINDGGTSHQGVHRSVGFELTVRNTTGSVSIPLRAPDFRTGMYRLRLGLADDSSLMLASSELYLPDLSTLELAPEAKVCVSQGLAAYEAGLYVASLSMIGAAVEAAWFALAEVVISTGSQPKLQTALDQSAPSAADIQQRTYAALRTLKVKGATSAVLATADHLREVRNYGVHPTSPYPGLAENFTRDSCRALLLLARRHSETLDRLAEGLRPSG